MSTEHTKTGGSHSPAPQITHLIQLIRQVALRRCAGRDEQQTTPSSTRCSSTTYSCSSSATYALYPKR